MWVGGNTPTPVVGSECFDPTPKDTRAELRRLCSRLGYATQPDAVDELAEWLRAQGFRSWRMVQDFLAAAAHTILPANEDARAHGLYLRHVRPFLDAWCQAPAVPAGVEP